MQNSLEKRPLWSSHKKELIIFFFAILFVSAAILFYFDAVPTELEFSSGKNDNEQVSAKKDIKAILPNHITIPKINVDTPVSNPVSDSISVLDEYLKNGSVHYPGSGSLSGGNMFIFAHSTGIKVVRNQAYKAFNDLKNLVVGDIVNVIGEDGKTYVYKVSSVKLATDKDVLVKFDKTNQMLTLSTCNTFGQKSERYVVEAYFDSVK